MTSIFVNNNSDIQRSLVTSIKVSFSEAVNFPTGMASAFVLKRTGFGLLGFVGLTFNPANGPVSSVTITLNVGGQVGIDPNSSLTDGIYRLTIVADQINGIGGTLDGDGDLIPERSPTDNKTRSFHRLFGDAMGMVPCPLSTSMRFVLRTVQAVRRSLTSMAITKSMPAILISFARGKGSCWYGSHEENGRWHSQVKNN